MGDLGSAAGAETGARSPRAFPSSQNYLLSSGSLKLPMIIDHRSINKVAYCLLALNNQVPNALRRTFMSDFVASEDGRDGERIDWDRRQNYARGRVLEYRLLPRRRFLFSYSTVACRKWLHTLPRLASSEGREGQHVGKSGVTPTSAASACQILIHEHLNPVFTATAVPLLSKPKYEILLSTGQCS